MGEIILDNYKKYYLKGYSGDLTNFCLYKTCCGQPWIIEKKKNEKTPFCLKILEKSRDIQGKRRELVILKDLGNKIL
jgi:hypothetical protein